MKLCDLDEIKICVDRQYENCHGYSGSKKAIYREAILAVKSILHSAKSIDGVTVQEWVSVADKIPPDQEEVLVLTQSKNGVRNVDKGYWSLDHFIHRGRSEVTHWMPMPAQPKGE